MENTAIEETVLETIIEKVLPATEETLLTEKIEICEESMKGGKHGTGKGVPKLLKQKSKEEVTEVTNDRRVEEIDTKEINEPRKEGLMRAIQNQHRRRSVRRILETFSVPREKIWHKTLKEATEEEVTAIILRWILDNLPAGGSVRIRSRDEDRDIFEFTIRKCRACLYAKNIRQCKNAKRLYRWRENITYNDLTIEEIEKSVRRAEMKDRKNRLRKVKGGKTIPRAVKECHTQTYDDSIFVDNLNQ